MLINMKRLKSVNLVRLIQQLFVHDCLLVCFFQLLKTFLVDLLNLLLLIKLQLVDGALVLVQHVLGLLGVSVDLSQLQLLL